MRKCSGCDSKLSEGARGNLCVKCYRKKDKNDSDDIALFSEHINQDGGNNGALGDDLERSIVELKISDLISIIKCEIKPIIVEVNKIAGQLKTIETNLKKVEEESSENTRRCNNISGDVETLKHVILEQQKFMEVVKRKDVANNIIVSGIPNSTMKVNNIDIVDIKDKLGEVFSFIGCQDKLPEEKDVRYLPIHEESEYHSVKIRLKDNDEVKYVIDKAKKLKDFKAAKVYINYDEPYYTRKENNRLRKKKAILKKDNVQDDIKILKGKLYHNNLMVDQFDLSNQIF